MNRNAVAESLRAEIAHLQKILEMVEQLPGLSAADTRGPGRPRGSVNKSAGVKLDPAAGKRAMSADRKARIAAAQKKRWAKVKRATVANTSATQTKTAGTRQSAKDAKKAVAPRPTKKSAVWRKTTQSAVRRTVTQPRKTVARALAESGPSTE